MMHKFLYRDQLSLSEAVSQIEGLKLSHPEAAADVQDMLDFLNQTPANRGIVR
jgi:UDP-N-acetylglucosamine acyltransferase